MRQRPFALIGAGLVIGPGSKRRHRAVLVGAGKALGELSGPTSSSASMKSFQAGRGLPDASTISSTTPSIGW